MKWPFQLALYDLAKRDGRVHLLIGDVGGVMFAQFRQDFPGRFLNCGICEQTMVGMAAGMASQGLRPIVYSITPFLLERAFEQIKLDVVEQKLPVGLVGYSDNSGGPTHKELNARETARILGLKSIFPETAADFPGILNRVNLDEPWFMFLGP